MTIYLTPVIREPRFTSRCHRWCIVDADSSDLAIYLTPSINAALLKEVESVLLQKPVVVLVDSLNRIAEPKPLTGKVWFVPVSLATGEIFVEKMDQTVR